MRKQCVQQTNMPEEETCPHSSEIKYEGAGFPKRKSMFQVHIQVFRDTILRGSSQTLNTQAAKSFETSTSIYRSARRHFPQGSNLQHLRCDCQQNEHVVISLQPQIRTLCRLQSCDTGVLRYTHLSILKTLHVDYFWESTLTAMGKKGRGSFFIPPFFHILHYGLRHADTSKWTRSTYHQG